MADPLSQLRQFHINGREIKEHNGYIIFGDHGWPKNVNTNYLVFSTTEDDKKEYYTLECLLYFLKNMDMAHQHYVKQAGSYFIPVVHRPDRKILLGYLKGELQTSPSIDKNAPIPSLRLPAAEIYKKAGGDAGSGSSQSGSGSQSTASGQNRADGSQGKGDGASGSAAKKRPHDPELEKKMREEFAAHLYKPSTKKLATIMPTETGESKEGEPKEGSAAISLFGAERLAAMRAKHLAVKRTTIIDADSEVGRAGAGGAAEAGSREAELLIAMDSDPSKLIKSKEKVWRTRSTILQSQTKNFMKTVMPMVNLLGTKGLEDPTQQRKMPPGPVDMQLNPYQPAANHHLQQQHQQQSLPRNAYNRYDQERFVKPDIDIEIDTRKSFVSGVANGLPTHNQLTSQPRAPTLAPPMPQALGNNPNNHPGTPMGARVNPAIHGGGRPSSGDTTDGRGVRSINLAPSNSKKRPSYIPIIIIPATTTSLINMRNAADILQDLTYVEGGSVNKSSHEREILIHRKKPDGSSMPYKIMDNPLSLSPTDWNRVVAVFVQGPAWQFKGWPWGGSPVEIFSRIKGYYLKWDESKVEGNVANWNVHILELSRNKRHLDKATLLKFWSSLDAFMVKYKSFLKF